MVDYSELTGGLRRIIERLVTEGTATENQEADDYLRAEPNAVLIAVFLEQRVRAETAFQGPLRLYQRLGHLDLRKIAEMDHAELLEVFTQTPAVHRFSNMMSTRLQKFCEVMVEKYDGDARKLWDVEDEAELRKRAIELPGIGENKAKKFRPAIEAFGHWGN